MGGKKIKGTNRQVYIYSFMDNSWNQVFRTQHCQGRASDSDGSGYSNPKSSVFQMLIKIYPSI